MVFFNLKPPLLFLRGACATTPGADRINPWYRPLSVQFGAWSLHAVKHLVLRGVGFEPREDVAAGCTLWVRKPRGGQQHQGGVGDAGAAPLPPLVFLHGLGGAVQADPSLKAPPGFKI